PAGARPHRRRGAAPPSAPGAAPIAPPRVRVPGAGPSCAPREGAARCARIAAAAMTSTLTTIDPEHPEAERLAEAARILKEGGLVAYPTETFYALGADPLEAAAVERVFTAKGRPGGMALPVLIGDRRHLSRVAPRLPPGTEALIDAFWPGPLTLVLPAADGLPARLLGGGRTIGVRLSSHPVARALANACDGPLVATSANRTGHPPPRTAAEAGEQLKGSLQ